MKAKAKKASPAVLKARSAARAKKALKVAKALKSLQAEAAVTTKKEKFNGIATRLKQLVTDMQLNAQATRQIHGALDELVAAK